MGKSYAEQLRHKAQSLRLKAITVHDPVAAQALIELAIEYEIAAEIALDKAKEREGKKPA